MGGRVDEWIDVDILSSNIVVSKPYSFLVRCVLACKCVLCSVSFTAYFETRTSTRRTRSVHHRRRGKTQRKSDPKKVTGCYESIE